MIRRYFSRSLLIAIILIHISLVIPTIFSTSPTYDEGGHVYAGLLYVQGGNLNYYYNNPPLAKYLFGLAAVYTKPIVNPPPRGVENWYNGFNKFMSINGPHYLDIINAARFISLIFSVLGCLVIYFWTKKMIGGRIAILATALWSFNPTMISLAALATPDMMAGVLFLATMYGLWTYTRNPNYFTASLVGLLASLSLVTKFSNILIYIFTIPLLLYGLYRSKKSIWQKSNIKYLYHVALVTLITFVVIGACYQWQGMPTRLAEQNFHSRLLSGQSPIIDFGSDNIYKNNGNRFQTGWLSIVGYLNLPLPKLIIEGFDSQMGHENFHLLAYLNGEWKSGGWFYYYLYTLILKTPIFVLLMSLLSLILWFRKKELILPVKTQLFLIVPPLFFFIVTSLATGINSHSRYILPVLPFFFIWASISVNYVVTKLESSTWHPIYKKRLCLFIVSLLIIMPVAKIHPHYLSYFNEIAGGPENGWKHLVDSNIDWGQDLIYLKKWLDNNPEVDKINLAYFGMTRPDFVLDPKRFTVATPFVQPITPSTSNKKGVVAKKTIRTGWYAISVNLLAGMPISIYGNNGEKYLSDMCTFCEFQNLEPVDRAGYSIYIYHLDKEDIKILEQPNP